MKMWWYWNCYFWTVFHGMICKVIKRVGNTVVLSLLVYSEKWTLSKDKRLHYKSNNWSSINCFTAHIHNCSIASKIVTRIQNHAWGGYLLSIPSFAPLNKGPLRDYYCNACGRLVSERLEFICGNCTKLLGRFIFIVNCYRYNSNMFPTVARIFLPFLLYVRHRMSKTLGQNGMVSSKNR